MLFATILALAGCGHGNGQGLDSDGNLAATADLGNQSAGTDTGGGDTGGSAGASGNPNATLTWVQDNVFGGVCTSCHKGDAVLGSVNWDSVAETCENVGRDSLEINTLKEIDSGNPDGSHLLWKLEGQGPNGEPIADNTGQMPLGMPPLEPDVIQNIRDWIADGTPGCSTSPRPSGNEDANHTTSSDLSAGAGSGEDSGHEPVSWKDVWNESLSVCTLCHSTNPTSPDCLAELECPPKGVVLTEDNYSGVVDGVTVVPFDPESSSLWQRVISTDHETRMPLGFAPLTGAQLDVIQNWIEDGAPFCPEGQVCP